MHPLCSLTCLATVFTTVLPAQFQAANNTARRVGLAVDVLASNVGVPSTLTLQAPPGAPVLLFYDTLASSDLAYGYGFPLITPSAIELGTPFAVDATGILSGTAIHVMPPSGTTSVPLPSPFPLPAGFVLDVQAARLGADPVSANSVALSNSVRRTTANLVGSAYTLGATEIPGSYLDVEQGDLDGDGDLDLVLVSCDGPVSVHLTVNGSLSATANLILLVPTATSCELVDLDNDNFLDIVVSQSRTGGSWLRNLGRGAPTGPSNLLGPWAGFTPVATPFPLAPGFGLANGTDIETADIDLDGNCDVLIGCGDNPLTGEQNRLFRNVTIPGALPTFVDVTGLQYPTLADDTEDVEFFDLDGDSDLDIVVGNFDGPAGVVGVDWYLVNAGGLQGGVVGTYGAPTALPGAVNDETLDVVVGDINLDGAPDIYVANWYGTAGNIGGPPWLPPQGDALYLTLGGVPFAFFDASNLLPDSPFYAGASPVPPAASSDAEIGDYDLDGDLDIYVPIGTRCHRQAPIAFGLRLLHNNILENGPPFALMPPMVLDPNGWLPPGMARDHSDIELGDFQTVFQNQDFGAATQATPISPGGCYNAQRN